MKKIGLLAAGLAVMLLLFPLVALKKTPVAKMTSAKVAEVDRKTAETYLNEGEQFRLLQSDGTVTTLSAEDYLCGVVAAEMPASGQEEALKAQAVASYTFACRRKNGRKGQNYDISADPSVDQAYLSPEELAKRWGDNHEKWSQKIRDAVAAVSGYLVTYQGEPALTAYHAISAGKTESSKNVWGSELPYLVCVDSSVDQLAEGYSVTTEISSKELKKAFHDIEFSGEAESRIRDLKRTAVGTVQKVTLCGKKVSGEDFRKAFSLRSANFTVKYKDGKYKITTYGYGHGVGMSQNGALEMAKQGSNFREILLKYYPGCKIEKIT